MPKHYRLLDHIVLLAAGIAGFANAPTWLILLTAGALTIEEWAKLWPLRSPAVTLSVKMVTYFVTGIVANVFYAAASYAIGTLARAFL